MSKRLILVIVVVALSLAMIGSLAGGKLLGSGDKAVPEVVGPGSSAIEEGSGLQEEPGPQPMPVPGFEGTPEMVVTGEEDSGAVSSGMPVPGFEDVPEMIVVEE